VARFTTRKKSAAPVKNYEGAEAYKLSDKMALYTAVCSASLQPKFYEPSSGVALKEISGLIAKNDPEFVAKLAVYAREEMFLRSIPLVLAVELAKLGHGNSLVSKMTERVIQRADELYEILGYYQKANARTKDRKKLNKLSNQLKLGIAAAFNKFDEYQFGKYNREGDITLRDALFLTHPKAKDAAQQALFDKIAKKELAVPMTWETVISAKGNKKESWEELIDAKKLPYMATLRNLRNIVNAEVSAKHLRTVLSYIENPTAVERSRQLPFRFVSAWRELSEIPEGTIPAVMEALNNAINLSVRNIEGFGEEERILIACDTSGSMGHSLSPKSSVMYHDIGLTLGMLLKSICKNVVTGIFGDEWRVQSFPAKSTLANIDAFDRLRGAVGHSTNGWKAIRWATEGNHQFDKMMFFTDCQWWDSDADMWLGTLVSHTAQSEWKRYKVKYPEAKAYFFDLAGYGNSPIRIGSNDVTMIGGWSNEVFKVLHAIENGGAALSRIEAINLSGRPSLYEVVSIRRL